FERLANFVLERLGRVPPEMLDDEGRVMVLRALLARKRDSLKLFRASARLTGFAQELSIALRELQETQLTADSLNQLADKVSEALGVASKGGGVGAFEKGVWRWHKEKVLEGS